MAHWLISQYSCTSRPCDVPNRQQVSSSSNMTSLCSFQNSFSAQPQRESRLKSKIHNTQFGKN
eukprot:1855377-Amphidinium_carterae.1